MILVNLVTPPLPPKTKLNFKQKFLGAKTLLGGGGGGGGGGSGEVADEGMNLEPIKKLSLGAGSYVTITWKGFSHTPEFFCPPL